MVRRYKGSLITASTYGSRPKGLKAYFTGSSLQYIELFYKKSKIYIHFSRSFRFFFIPKNWVKSFNCSCDLFLIDFISLGVFDHHFLVYRAYILGLCKSLELLFLDIYWWSFYINGIFLVNLYKNPYVYLFFYSVNSTLVSSHIKRVLYHLF